MAEDPTTQDEGFELLPPETEPPDAGAELALEDELAAGADDLAIDVPEPPPLGRSYAYDFIEHGFVPSQAGGPLPTHGLETLAVWGEKCLRTRRGENPACDPDFGMDLMPQDLLDGGPFDASAMAEYEADIRRALLVHPRIVDVDSFAVEYAEGDDAVAVSFRVIPEGDDLDDLDFDRLPLPLGAS